MAPRDRAYSVKLYLALGSIYFIWGSTYLAISYAVKGMPPFLMAGTRFLLAGLILAALHRIRGGAWPDARMLVPSALVGILLFLGGNGGVVWAEQFVPSSHTALIIAFVPAWMLLIDWLFGSRTKPEPATIVGFAAGLVGIALLVLPEHFSSFKLAVDPIGFFVLVISAISWAGGSIYARYARLPSSPFLTTALQQLFGGAALIVASVVAKEPSRLSFTSISPVSFLAFAYLVVFGSIIALSAYSWLLKNAPPAQVATYAYVNPVVAVFLGWLIAGEPLTFRKLIATAIIVASVAIITAYQVRKAAPLEEPV